MKHKSGHKISTKDFSNKKMLDLNSPLYLAPKNKVRVVKQIFAYPFGIFRVSPAVNFRSIIPTGVRFIIHECKTAIHTHTEHEYVTE